MSDYYFQHTIKDSCMKYLMLHDPGVWSDQISESQQGWALSELDWVTSKEYQVQYRTILLAQYVTVL